MNEKRRFKAEIMGKSYTILGQQSAEHLEAVVAIVNQQLQELQELAPNLSREDHSILMAINAVSDQVQKEMQLQALEEQLKQLPKSSNRDMSSNQTDNLKLDSSNAVEQEGRRPQIPFERPSERH